MRRRRSWPWNRRRCRAGTCERHGGSAAANGSLGSGETQALDPLDGGGELVRAGSLIREPSTNRPVGVVIASGFLSGDLAKHARRITEIYENYSQLHVAPSGRSRACTCRCS